MQRSAIDFTPLMNNLLQHSNSEIEFNKYLEDLGEKVFKNEAKIKDLLKINDKTLSELYSHAYELFKYGKYDLSASLFYHLLGFDSQNPHYSYGLAASFAEQKKYKIAITAFIQTLFNNPSDPKPLFNCAECSLSLGDKDKAKEYLRYFIDLSKNKEGYESLHTKATLMLDKLSQQKN
jgi:type III secretion system low calcium response chaperone LcrH/SycD